MTGANGHGDRKNFVAREDACPKCGERDSDRLVWIDDGERVECQQCKTVYQPGGVRDGDDDAMR